MNYLVALDDADVEDWYLSGPRNTRTPQSFVLPVSSFDKTMEQYGTEWYDRE